MASATACLEIYLGTTDACPSSARDSCASPTLSLYILAEIGFHLSPRKRSVRISHRARSLSFALTSPLSSTILLRVVTSPRTCQHQTSAREKRIVLQLWMSLLLLPNRRRQRRVSRDHSLIGIYFHRVLLLSTLLRMMQFTIRGLPRLLCIAIGPLVAPPPAMSLLMVVVPHQYSYLS